MNRVSRTIRLDAALWRALDRAALDISSRSGRYCSANALIEEILRTRLPALDTRDREPASIGQARAARARKQANDTRRIAWHKRLAGHLARATVTEQRSTLERAAAEIRRWKRARLASPIYIEAWSRLIAEGPHAIARAMGEGYQGLSPTALAANSPFSSAGATREAA
jgi:hypothetical protein